MKTVVAQTHESQEVTQNDRPKAEYQAPEVQGTTGKVTMSGAGCPDHTVQWQQVSCKC